jgi:outer membrane protein assembly factor BamA
MLRTCSLLLAIAACAAPPAQAQSTRREAIEQQRAARAANAEPYEPGALEGALLYVERNRIVERLSGTQDGWYPSIGSVTRGGGFALGGGWRRHFARERVLFNTGGAWSMRGYRTGRIELRFPRVARDRIELGVRARHRYFPQEDYYGLGAGSGKDDRSDYLLSETELAGFGLYRPVRWLSWGAQVAHLSPSIRAGTDSRYPDIASQFTPSTAPGLASQPNFLEMGTLLDVDYRDQPGNPRSGGRYAMILARISDRNGSAYDYSRVSAVAEQYFPVFDKKRAFAVRVVAHHYAPDAGATVPFYYLPSVGGRDTVRGYSDFRFRDNNALVFNAEYRWEAFAGLDMALFYDRGTVGHGWSDISLADMKQSYGLSFRFNTYKAVFMRADVAFGGEGTRTYIAFGAPLRIERYLR